ncbi:histone-lysine N-methyltransferase 2D-like isoform X2 [Strigops habroptila]|uniref:histone-lysine N-methyltransferase 2D-like isoform X2 n=1 Tax=Strigops habroptila TaxID=2489341 RepID=UPI0011CF7973|nr:histone-lysine N-methyltransferase 2D-like isoform X2 [Strigops habroptila]
MGVLGVSLWGLWVPMGVLGVSYGVHGSQWGSLGRPWVPTRVSGGPWGVPRVLVALEAALALEEEDGDVPAPLLVEHLVDTRRKQKLLLAQLRVLQLLLGLVENPGPPLAPPGLPEAVSEARGRWQELKSGYGGAVAALGGALPPALAQIETGQRLLQRLRGALRGAQKRQKELEVKLKEARGRRDQLQQRLEQRRRERLGQQGALRHQQRAAQRAEAGCRLYQVLAGVRVLLPPPGRPELELELGPPPGLPDSLPSLRLCRSPGGGFDIQGPSLPLPPPLGPGLVELQERCWEGRPLWAEVEQLQRRFALDWEPSLRCLRVLGGSGTLWMLELEPGYPQRGGVRVLPPLGVAPPSPPPSACPTLTQWLELLVRPPQNPPK